ncbi:transcriptional regulator [Kribbella pittospori]|uniref:Transcriptional regulator n=1 Tax=Kribbella pittospori TaxID=722689 RepID=A0A4R0JI16_9ACTN|nr:BTAD domain-containing putative transcriptional regulator [Kribbella pittospori]TCC46149.1 transcriptional regulator [Kribbella pittospori]
MGADQLRISLLGEFTASYGGAALDLGGRRQRAVLAVLVLARGEVVPAERLADAVWGEHAPGNTAGALQSYVSHLRRSLQPGSPARARSAIVVREGPGYAVRLPSDAVDAWRFETLLKKTTGSPADAAADLHDALALWRGPALVEYADEPWAGAEIARLTELRAVARERLVAARLDLGEAALVVAELEGMVAEEPLREERWRLLALGLYRAHRQADALAALRRARETLADELGVDPGPALRELEAQVLAQSPGLAAAGQPREEPVQANGRATTADRNGLVDRDRELAALRSMLDGLAGGQPGLLLFEGPAGIGKTRLLAEARKLAAERSVRVLSARGSALESAFAFGVVRQLFEGQLGDPARRDELLRGAAAGAGAVFDITDSGRAEGFAVLHGLYWLAVNLTTGGPLVLAVDDAQWCDGASLRFLAYLVRRLASVPVLVLATLRTGEQHDDEDLIAELALEPDALVVRPAPLSTEATAELVERRLGVRPAPLFVTACERTTAGNPFLLCQLLQALAADGVRPDASHADRVVAVGSRAVSSRVLLQLRRLPPDVVVVARAASVLGDGAALPAVAALAGVTEARTAEALAVLARAEIVRDEQPVAFAHPLVRDAVYQAQPAAERELCHERAASVLRDARTSDELVAAHLLLAPPRGDESVVTLLRTAAREAAERGASESAVTYLRRALVELPVGSGRRDVVLELGMREASVDGGAAVEHLVHAYRLQDHPRVRSEIAIAAASTQVFASPPGVATTFAREAAAELPDGLADQRQALIAIQRISGFMHGISDGWHTPAQEPEGQGAGARMLAATVALEAVLAGRDRERAIAMARFALDGDHLIAVDDGLFWVNAAAVRILSDDDIGDFWSRARAASHARGSLFAALSTSLWEGFWQWRRGELHEALACLRAALDQDRLWGGTRVGEPFARAFQIGCQLDRGDLEAARRAADALAAGAVAGEGGRVYQQAVARLRVAEGRCEEALVVLGNPQPGIDGIDIVNPVWNPWRSIKAAALFGLGRTSEAIETAEEELALLRIWGAPSFLGRALCTLGELRGRAGIDNLVEAVDLLSATTAAVDLARAKCALGSHPDVGGVDAIALLEDASRMAQERGAGQVRERALAELERRGRRIELSTDDVPRLSRTDRQILDLTAAGLDVHEVAQRLFVTPGTVRDVLDGAGFTAGPSGSRISQVGRVTMTHDQNGRLQ